MRRVAAAAATAGSGASAVARSHGAARARACSAAASTQASVSSRSSGVSRRTTSRLTEAGKRLPGRQPVRGVLRGGVARQPDHEHGRDLGVLREPLRDLLLEGRALRERRLGERAAVAHVRAAVAGERVAAPAHVLRRDRERRAQRVRVAVADERERLAAGRAERARLDEAERLGALTRGAALGRRAPPWPAPRSRWPAPRRRGSPAPRSRSRSASAWASGRALAPRSPPARAPAPRS